MIGERLAAPNRPQSGLPESLIQSVVKGAHENMKSAGVCEMCGHHVGVRQRAHIMAEGKKTENNVYMKMSAGVVKVGMCLAAK